jgi:hypothetical protein
MYLSRRSGLCLLLDRSSKSFTWKSRVWSLKKSNPSQRTRAQHYVSSKQDGMVAKRRIEIHLAPCGRIERCIISSPPLLSGASSTPEFIQDLVARCQQCGGMKTRCQVYQDMDSGYTTIQESATANVAVVADSDQEDLFYYNAESVSMKKNERVFIDGHPKGQRR